MKSQIKNKKLGLTEYCKAAPNYYDIIIFNDFIRRALDPNSKEALKPKGSLMLLK